MLGIFLTSSVKGATLTDAEYARLKLVFSDLRIATMSDEDASRYLSYDLENSKKVNKYYIKGVLYEDSIDGSSKAGDYYLIVTIDNSQKLFDITPYDGKIFKEE